MRVVVALSCFALAGCELVFSLGAPAPATDAPGPDDDAAITIDAPDTVSVYEQAVLDDAPLAYWRFGADSELAALDSTDHGHEGEYLDITFEPGPIIREATTDRAATFGNQSLISMGPKFGFEGKAPFTIELWAKAAVNTNTGGIVSKNTETGGSERQGWTMFILDDSRGVFFERTVNNSDRQEVQTTEALTVNGPWTHIVVTYDGTDLRLFVNGAARGTGVGENVDVPPQVAADFVLGGRDSGNAIERFKGAIDEVAVYNYALSDTRIASHHLIAITP